MNKAEFNQLFDAAFEAASRSGPSQQSPDYRPSWEKLQNKLIRHNRAKRTLANLSKLAILAATLLLGAFIFGNAAKVRAISPIFSTLYESSAGALSYFFGRAEDQDPSKAKTAPPPDVAQSDNSGQPITRTIETDALNAGELLAFPAPTFNYLPDGYKPDKVLAGYSGDKARADAATYIFVNNDGNKITISFVKLDGQTGLTANQSREGVKVEKVELKDGPGVLYTASNGSTKLETVTDGLQVSLSGILPADQILRVYDETSY